MKLEFFPLAEKHLEMIRNWRNLPEVNKYLYADHYISKEEHLKWFQTIRTDPTRRHWVVAVDDQIVAYVCLYDINLVNRRCSWAYYIADPLARGKGIGKQIELNIQNYVFGDLKLNKLFGEILASNEFSIKIHQKYGSQIEGRLRQHIFKGGKFEDVLLMRILREEWLQIKDNFDFVPVKIP